MRCAAILLAAGSASRMGHRPKCLIERDGHALIRRSALALLDAGIQELVVVLGHYAQEVGPAVAGLPVTVVVNPNPEQGIISSQRLGLLSITSTCDAVRAEVLQANDDFGCQTWRQHNRAWAHAWASDNLHYVTDLDSQADIADLQQRGIDLRWPDPNAG